MYTEELQGGELLAGTLLYTPKGYSRWFWPPFKYIHEATGKPIITFVVVDSQEQ